MRLKYVYLHLFSDIQLVKYLDNKTCLRQKSRSSKKLSAKSSELKFRAEMLASNCQRLGRMEHTSEGQQNKIVYKSNVVSTRDRSALCV